MSKKPPTKKKTIAFVCPKEFRKDGKPKTTFRVWQIADQITAKNAVLAKKKKIRTPLAKRSEVLEQCLKEKIKYSTFNNSFYRWRKAKGTFGRVKKDGTVAKLGKQPKKAAPRKKVAKKPAKIVSFPVPDAGATASAVQG